jgi:hypothetical protein
MDNIWYIIERPLKIVFFGILLALVALAPFASIDGMNLIQYLLQ